MHLIRIEIKMKSSVLPQFIILPSYLITLDLDVIIKILYILMGNIPKHLEFRFIYCKIFLFYVEKNFSLMLLYMTATIKTNTI